ncbi:phage minor head protein [Xanthobacter tagetidis]|uniref:Head morphogenesis protein n=1 Tax=Xanthobacter tagetidis TaxID=60216 RepID=A0A3L7AHI0_9HYPH|nr:phage minor head protein [Xanthobacter tagetidis]MBB6306222.1 hypothetical protein [Xanthobacter tagetidis]RLP79504.1 head morphogenesis protein [Xanthobacter tagetidis]
MSEPQSIEDLIVGWEVYLQRMFLDAVYAMRDRAQIGLLAQMLERGDIEGAVRAVGLDPVDFRGLEAGIATAFEAGGRLTTTQIPGTKDPSGYVLKIQFDVRAPEAEAFLRSHSAQQVVEINDDQRAMLRQHLTVAMEEGRNPRTVASEVVGKVNPATGRREGGVLGLASSQVEWVHSYEARLRSGDPAEMKKALEMTLRDKRFDKTVEKAIREGSPIPAEKIDRMVVSYRNRALTYRSETIGRLEAMTALSEGRDQAWRQAIAKGQVRAEHLIKTWKTAKDEKVRGTHRVLEGKIVGFDESFLSPSGAMLRYPHDPKAPGYEIIGCRCTASYRLDYTGKIRRGDA